MKANELELIKAAVAAAMAPVLERLSALENFNEKYPPKQLQQERFNKALAANAAAVARANESKEAGLVAAARKKAALNPFVEVQVTPKAASAGITAIFA